MEQRDLGPGSGGDSPSGAGADGPGAADGGAVPNRPVEQDGNPDLAATVVNDGGAAPNRPVERDGNPDLAATVVNDGGAESEAIEARNPDLDVTVAHDLTTARRPRTVAQGTVLSTPPTSSYEAATPPTSPYEAGSPPPPAYSRQDPEYLFSGADDRAPRQHSGSGSGYGSGPAPDSDSGSGPRGPRRWVLVASAALAAIALASTAAAIAAQNSGSHAAASGQTDGVTTTSDAPSGTPDDSTTPGGSPSSTASSTSATTTTSSPTPAATKTSATPKPKTSSPTSSPAPGDNNETSCEDASHDTPADEAVKFTGMTKGTQAAFLAAQADAKTAHVTFTLNSGYRTAAYQQRIFDCWVKQLGSAQAARKYALPPSESAHVKGYAMDIAPQSAAAWLQASAGKYGLCRRYADEPWHFEYQSSYKTKGCPALLPQP